ncbi:MAG TPA: cell division protein ZapB [Candidatus Norongarragalinales archaeon]|nr:cell division protein ZapB [Candidatus Norongarragalinales archaeon]
MSSNPQQVCFSGPAPTPSASPTPIAVTPTPTPEPCATQCIDDDGTCHYFNERKARDPCQVCTGTGGVLTWQTVSDSSTATSQQGIDGICCAGAFKPASQFCRNNADCRSPNTCEKPTCTNPATCSASCQNTVVCDGSTCSKKSRDYYNYCIDNDISKSCGDGVCNFIENGQTCPRDCAANATEPSFSENESFTQPAILRINEQALFLLKYNSTYPIAPNSPKCETVPAGVACSCVLKDAFIECSVDKAKSGDYVFAAADTAERPFSIRYSVDPFGRTTAVKSTPTNLIVIGILALLALGITGVLAFWVWPKIDYEINKPKRIQEQLDRLEKEYKQALFNVSKGFMRPEQFKQFEDEYAKKKAKLQAELRQLESKRLGEQE